APTWACAANTASCAEISESTVTPRYAAVSAPKEHPVPSTSCNVGSPERNHVTRSADTIKSSAPETATTPPVRLANNCSASNATSTESVASTPRPPAPSPASATTSEAFPRIAAGCLSTIPSAYLVLSDNPPTATG